MTYQPKSLGEIYMPTPASGKALEYYLKDILELRGNFNVRSRKNTIITVTPERLFEAVGELWQANQ